MKRSVALTAVLMLSALSVSGQLSKYKDWDLTPEGHFLTPAERREWRKVRTDEEAAVFVAAFVDKRGGEAFLAEVEKRTRSLTSTSAAKT